MRSLIPIALLLFSNGAEVEVTRFRAPDGPTVDDVRAVHRDADGRMWIGTNGGGVSVFDGEDWTHHHEDAIGMAGVAAIFPGAGADLWFAGPGGVSRFDGESWEQLEPDREIRVAFSGFVEASGEVWLGTNLGAARFDGESWQWTTSGNGLKHDVVHDVLRDRSGNLWFATRRGGLSRLGRDGDWEHFLTGANVRKILEDDEGHLWFGTGGTGVHRFDGTWIRVYGDETVLPLFQDSRGNIWFSRPGRGALRYRNGEWTEHTEHVPDGEIHAMGEGADQSLWFGAGTGLTRLRKVK